MWGGVGYVDSDTGRALTQGANGWMITGPDGSQVAYNAGASPETASARAKYDAAGYQYQAPTYSSDGQQFDPNAAMQSGYGYSPTTAQQAAHPGQSATFMPDGSVQWNYPIMGNGGGLGGFLLDHGSMIVGGVAGLAGLAGAGAMGGSELSGLVSPGAEAGMATDGLGASLSGAGGFTSAAPGTYPWLDATGNLDVSKFLDMTGPGGSYADAIPGGAEGIPGIDTAAPSLWDKLATPDNIKNVVKALSSFGGSASAGGTTGSGSGSPIQALDNSVQNGVSGSVSNGTTGQKLASALENPTLQTTENRQGAIPAMNIGMTDVNPLTMVANAAGSTWNSKLAQRLMQQQGLA